MKKFELKEKVFKDLSKTADKLGLPCYVVGGYVRDLILGRPNDDIDIVVVGSGIKMAEAFAEEIGSKNITTYKNFGTAKVDYHGLEVEFVGARKESYTRGSRKPIVEDGTLEDDQVRRDFTINAMAICLNSSSFGTLVDPFNGVEDIERKLIITPTDPKITFSDDPLRMLRCIRFAVKLGFEIHESTLEAIHNNCARLEIISPERITGELDKILMSPDPCRGIRLLHTTGLLHYILPEVEALNMCDDEPGRHKDNFEHTLDVLRGVSEKNGGLWLRYAALLHDIGKEPTKKYDPLTDTWTFYDHEHVGARMVGDIFKRLKLPLGDREMKYVQKLVDMHMRPSMCSCAEITDSAVRRLLFDAGPDIDDLLLLCRSDLSTKNQVKKEKILRHFDILEIMIEDLKKRDQVRLFQPVIKGDEIMEMFGLAPGKMVGILKQYIKDLVLDGEVENEREVLKEKLIWKAKELGVLKKN